MLRAAFDCDWQRASERVEGKPTSSDYWRAWGFSMLKGDRIQRCEKKKKYRIVWLRAAVSNRSRIWCRKLTHVIILYCAAARDGLPVSVVCFLRCAIVVVGATAHQYISAGEVSLHKAQVYLSSTKGTIVWVKRSSLVQQLIQKSTELSNCKTSDHVTRCQPSLAAGVLLQ